MPNPIHILVVDDEAMIRTTCQRSLSRLGYRVDIAPNAEEALRRAHEEPYEVVITDISMPGAMDGKGLVEAVRRKSPGTDIVVMTGYPSLDSAIPVMKQGAVDYLIKPFDAYALQQTVERCCERRRLKDELNQERKLREELQAAYAELEELSRTKEAFVSRLNHELRIPLTPALLAVDILSQQTKDPQTLQLCALTRKRLTQLQGLIDNLLMFGDLKDKALDIPWTRISLRRLWSRLVEQGAAEWHERNIHLFLDFPREATLVRGIPGLIEVAFKQLLQNAVLFNRNGGTVTVASRFISQIKQVAISVTDTGIGIPKRETEKVFDSFYQVAHYLTREVGGVGLGLALVKRIAEKHGGRVSVHSVSRRGSTFTIYLPAA